MFQPGFLSTGNCMILHFFWKLLNKKENSCERFMNFAMPTQKPRSAHSGHTCPKAFEPLYYGICADGP